MVSPVLLKDFGLQFCTGSLLEALSCLGRNPTIPPLSAGVEEVMEHKQALRAEHTKNELPDTGGIQVQAACSPVERLQRVYLL